MSEEDELLVKLCEQWVQEFAPREFYFDAFVAFARSMRDAGRREAWGAAHMLMEHKCNPDWDNHDDERIRMVTEFFKMRSKDGLNL